jgi:hypothetical protein
MYRDGSSLAKIKRPLILRLYGGALYKIPKAYSEFVIIEEQYANLCSFLRGSISKGNILPIELIEILQKSDFLLLGYNANDANLRSIFHSLFKESRWHEDFDSNKKDIPKGWLIDQSLQGEVSHKQYWNHWGIDLVEYSLDDFIKALKDKLLKER